MWPRCDEPPCSCAQNRVVMRPTIDLRRTPQDQHLVLMGGARVQFYWIVFTSCVVCVMRLVSPCMACCCPPKGEMQQVLMMAPVVPVYPKLRRDRLSSKGAAGFAPVVVRKPTAPPSAPGVATSLADTALTTVHSDPPAPPDPLGAHGAGGANTLAPQILQEIIIELIHVIQVKYCRTPIVIPRHCAAH